jgi:hypothetical protein
LQKPYNFLNETSLAIALKGFNVHPEKYRDGAKTFRGYVLDHGLKDAFERYLPSQGGTHGTHGTLDVKNVPPLRNEDGTQAEQVKGTTSQKKVFIPEFKGCDEDFSALMEWEQ